MEEKNYHIEGDTLIINDGVTAIDAASFHYYKYNKAENTEDIGNIKEEFKNIKNVILPDSITSISDFAFYGHTSLENVTIPNGVKSIEDLTFSACANLKSITIPNGVKSIGVEAFYDCPSLESAVLPDSVASIDTDAFVLCRNLTIKCNKGSYAEEYAKEHCIPVEYLEDKSLRKSNKRNDIERN